MKLKYFLEALGLRKNNVVKVLRRVCIKNNQPLSILVPTKYGTNGPIDASIEHGVHLPQAFKEK